jgi:hypothetical protein
MLFCNILAVPHDVLAQGPVLYPGRDHARVLTSAAPVHEHTRQLDNVFMQELTPLESFLFYPLWPMPWWSARQYSNTLGIKDSRIEHA